MKPVKTGDKSMLSNEKYYTRCYVYIVAAATRYSVQLYKLSTIM